MTVEIPVGLQRHPRCRPAGAATLPRSGWWCFDESATVVGTATIGGTVAQRTTVVVTDDLDGSEGANTVTFAFEGVEYEVDLSASNAKKLKKALDPYISAARKTGGRRSSGRRSATRSGRSSSGDTAAIREWARSQGLQVSERGRVPQSLRDQYAAANA